MSFNKINKTLLYIFFNNIIILSFQVPENPTMAVEEVMTDPGRLKDLDLDAFAEELARQGYGNKEITLYDIRDELSYRFKDHRPPYRGLSSQDRFQLLTGETQQTLFYGKMITCLATGFAFKKATREELDSANPTRNDDTNLWKCPFCLKDTFLELSEVSLVLNCCFESHIEVVTLCIK